MTNPLNPPDTFLPLPVYATSADYLASEGLLPDTQEMVDSKLAKASRLIDTVLIGSLYQVDLTTNLPTDVGALAGLKGAVIAQVAFWYSGFGSEYGQPMYDDVQIGSLKLKRGKATSGVPQEGTLVAPQAMYFLTSVGLLPISARTFG